MKTVIFCLNPSLVYNILIDGPYGSGAGKKY